MLVYNWGLPAFILTKESYSDFYININAYRFCWVNFDNDYYYQTEAEFKEAKKIMGTLF